MTKGWKLKSRLYFIVLKNVKLLTVITAYIESTFDSMSKELLWSSKEELADMLNNAK